MHGAAVAKAHFDFRRMDIHIDQCRIQFQRQHVGGIAVAVQHVLIGGAHRVGQQFVAHEAAIDIEILRIGACLGGSRQASKTMQTQAAGSIAGGFVQRQPGRGEILAQDMRAALRHLGGVPVVDGFAIVRQRKGHIRPCQRDAAHHFGAMAEFGLIGLQKFAPSRGIEIQVLHINSRAGRTRGGRCAAGRCAGNFPGVGGIQGARSQRQLRHRGDRGQRFAPKTQRGNVFQIVQRSNFGCRMTRQGQRHLLRCDAASIVSDSDALDAALFQPYGDVGGTGVERVFEQLFDHGRGTFHHFAGGDLGDQLVG